MSDSKHRRDEKEERPTKKRRVEVTVVAKAPKKFCFLWKGGQLIADSIPAFSYDIVNVICCYTRQVLPDDVREQLLCLTGSIWSRLLRDGFWFDSGAPFDRRVNIQRCGCDHTDAEKHEHAWWIEVVDGMFWNKNWNIVPCWREKRHKSGKPTPPQGVPKWIVKRHEDDYKFYESQMERVGKRYTVSFGEERNNRVRRFYQWRRDESTKKFDEMQRGFMYHGEPKNVAVLAAVHTAFDL